MIEMGRVIIDVGVSYLSLQLQNLVILGKGSICFGMLVLRGEVVSLQEGRICQKILWMRHTDTL